MTCRRVLLDERRERATEARVRREKKKWEARRTKTEFLLFLVRLETSENGTFRERNY